MSRRAPLAFDRGPALATSGFSFADLDLVLDLGRAREVDPVIISIDESSLWISRTGTASSNHMKASGFLMVIRRAVVLTRSCGRTAAT
jgi:hypothetical protein